MSHPDRPPPSTVCRAIDAYLSRAYDGPLPAHVAALVERVRGSPEEGFYDSGAFEKGPGAPPEKYSLRLGNRHYLHMKLVVERMPSRDAWFFRADTHDAHIALGPDDPEYAAFKALMARNREVADAVEAAWAEAGVDTFRAFLHRDLEARRGAAGGVS